MQTKFKIKNIFVNFTYWKFGLLLCAMFVFSRVTKAQNKTSFTCGYNTAVKPDFCDIVYENKYITDYGVSSKVQEIVDIVGLPQNFILVECSNVNNAYSFLSPTGTRYIVIDSQWLTGIGSNNWFILGILAH